LVGFLEVSITTGSPAAMCRPSSVRSKRRQALAIRWLIIALRNRGEKTTRQRMAGEIMDAAAGRGNAVKKREDTHRMADANKAFSHYKW
jgi:small subunit ribosomal protein S7